jgi:predicted acetyltransferase
MLRNVLRYAKDYDIDRVLLAVEPRNAAGKRVIEKNGGEFLDKVLDPEYEIELERYSIGV